LPIVERGIVALVFTGFDFEARNVLGRRLANCPVEIVPMESAGK
jgi:hypothetical protein